MKFPTAWTVALVVNIGLAVYQWSRWHDGAGPLALWVSGLCAGMALTFLIAIVAVRLVFSDDDLPSPSSTAGEGP